VEEVSPLHHHDRGSGDEGSNTNRNRFGHKRDKSRDVNENADRAAIERDPGKSEDAHRNQQQELRAFCSGKNQAGVDSQEDRIETREFTPHNPAALRDRIQYKKDRVDQPDKVVEAAVTEAIRKTVTANLEIRSLRSSRDRIGIAGCFSGEKVRQRRTAAIKPLAIHFERQWTQAFASLRVKMIHAAPSINRVNPVSASQCTNMLPAWA